MSEAEHHSPLKLFEELPIIKSTLKWMSSNDMDTGPFLAIFSFGLLLIGFVVMGLSLGAVLSVFFALTPIWLPFILFYLFYGKWMDYVGAKFALGQGRVTLRIKLPQEVFKSPEAMEMVIAQLHNVASPDNLMQTYLDGKRPLNYSFEIVSIGGEVRLYVNVPRRKTKEAFEANMYAQYPGIEISEEPVDYAAEIPLDTDKWDWMSFHMGKKKPGEFPLRTYIELGLDKLPKEEEKVDPMTPILDVWALIKPHERLYMQFLCNSFRPPSFKNGQLRMSEGPSWPATVAKAIDEIMRRDNKTKGPIKKEDSESDFEGMPRLTPGERSTIEVMERNGSKYPYLTAIRWIYLVEKGKFNGDVINPVIRAQQGQFDVLGRNSIGVRWRTDFGYKDIIPGGKKKKLSALKKQEFKEYKMRKYFPKGAGDKPVIFSSEELATIFHIPGKVALTPTLARIPSARSEAPSNLPTGTLPI